MSLLIPALQTGQICRFGRVSSHWKDKTDGARNIGSNESDEDGISCDLVETGPAEEVATEGDHGVRGGVQANVALENDEVKSDIGVVSSSYSYSYSDMVL